MHKGSRIPSLSCILKELYWFCLLIGVTLQVLWVPRKENAEADALSKLDDTDDWQLNPEIFRSLDCKWGGHTVDRFASDLNALCPRFFSRFYSPGCEGVDAFAYHWGNGENNWINPPFGLIGRVITKLRSDRAVASVVLPLWPSRPWWHLVAADGQHLAYYVTDWVHLDRSRDVFLPGRFSGNQEPRGRPSWRIIVARFDFSEGAPELPIYDRCLAGGCAFCHTSRRD